MDDDDVGGYVVAIGHEADAGLIEKFYEEYRQTPMLDGKHVEFYEFKQKVRASNMILIYVEAADRSGAGYMAVQLMQKPEKHARVIFLRGRNMQAWIGGVKAVCIQLVHIWHAKYLEVPGRPAWHRILRRECDYWQKRLRIDSNGYQRRKLQEYV